MEDVIELSPSPELLPRSVYRPLRRKRNPLFILDGDESVIELTDSTDSQSSTPCKRVRRLVDTVEPSAAPSSSSYVSVALTRPLRCDGTSASHLCAMLTLYDLSPRPMGRTHKLRRSHSPAPWHPAPVLSRATSPTQNPYAYPVPNFGQDAIQLESWAGPGSDRLPKHDPRPAPEHVPVDHKSPQPVDTADSEVVQEPDERLVERVREVVPDVLPAHVFQLLAQHKAAFSDVLLDVVIHNLLEDQSYPRDTKGKGKERAVEKKLADILDDNMSVDYRHPNADRPVGPAYSVLSLVCINVLLPRMLLTCVEQKYLYANFPDVDKTYVLEALSLHEGHYTPAYLYLLQHGLTPASVVPASPKVGKRRRKVNRKSSLNEDDLVREHIWLVGELENRRSAPVSEDPMPQSEEEGEGIECGCCFSSFPFVRFPTLILLSH
jgi:E3 ubiquitin-protein ligase RNF216